MEQLKIIDTVFSKEKTNVCISLMAKSIDDIQIKLDELSTLEFDVLEWRSDYYQNLHEYKKVTTMIKEYFGSIPLIFTYRTKDEGGLGLLDDASYYDLLSKIASDSTFDILDIEVDKKIDVNSIIMLAQKNGIKTVLSKHDFLKTPTCNEIITKLCQMQDSKADIIKVAYMPLDSNDVLSLLNASVMMKDTYATKPYITISMGDIGMISRLATKLTGSCMTFAAAQEVSAPGQVSTKDLSYILALLDR